MMPDDNMTFDDYDTDDAIPLMTLGAPPQARRTRAPLRVMTINCAGLNDASKRRACFTYLRQQQCDVYLLSETHLASSRARSFWEKGWARGKATASWWSISASAHTGGAAVLIRPDLPLTEVSVEMDESSGRGSWVSVCGTVAGVRWNWKAVYLPAGPALRMAALTSPTGCPPPCPPDARELMGGDFNCVEDAVRDTYNRPDYANAGGSELASLTAARGLRDMWMLARRAHQSSGMTLWRGTAGSRIDRLYLGGPADLQVREVTTRPWAQSDHLAVKAVIEEAGPSTRSYSKCFTANRDLAESDAGQEVVRRAILHELGVHAEESAGERWCRVKEGMRAALRGFAQACAQRRRQVRSEEVVELDSLASAHPLTPPMQARLTHLKASLARQEGEAARGAALRCRCKWLAEGERCSSYFLGMEKARRAPPGTMTLEARDGATLTSRTKIAREVRQVWGEIFAEPPEHSRSGEQAAVRTFLDGWPAQLSKEASTAAHVPIGAEEASEQLGRMRAAAAPGPDGLPVSVLRAAPLGRARTVVAGHGAGSRGAKGPAAGGLGGAPGTAAKDPGATPQGCPA